jgi:hypothetical protein
MMSLPNAECLPLLQDCDEGAAMAHGALCRGCVVVRRDAATGMAGVVDMARALEDFDSNAAAVNGLLQDFLGDRNGCVRQLAGLAGASRQQARVVVHDVANTLDAGWCRLAALAVRRHEERLRRDASSPVDGIVAEVQAIVQQAFDGAHEQLAHCAPCLFAATA